MSKKEQSQILQCINAVFVEIFMKMTLFFLISMVFAPFAFCMDAPPKEGINSDDFAALLIKTERLLDTTSDKHYLKVNLGCVLWDLFTTFSLDKKLEDQEWVEAFLGFYNDNLIDCGLPEYATVDGDEDGIKIDLLNDEQQKRLTTKIMNVVVSKKTKKNSITPIAGSGCIRRNGLWLIY